MDKPKQPEIVREALEAAEWVAMALKSSGYRANFSLNSLKEIDRFFDEQAPRGVPKPGGLLSENLSARIFALGAYVGEVIRRRTKGEWVGDDSDPEAEINLILRPRPDDIIWPVQRVMKRFRNGPEECIYHYGLVIAPPRFHRFRILHWLWLRTGWMRRSSWRSTSS